MLGPHAAVEAAQSAVTATDALCGESESQIGSVLGLIVAYYFYKRMMASEKGNEKMETIASYVREGAYAYLFRQYKVVALVFLVLFLIFVWM